MRIGPRRLALGGAVLAAVVVIIVGGLADLNRGRPATAAAGRTVVKVARGTVSVSEAAAGAVAAAQTRGLSFSLSGPVTSLPVRVGDRVDAGDVLAEIDDSDAQDAVSAAESAVASAEDAVSAAEAATQSASPCPSGSRTCTTTNNGGTGNRGGSSTDSLFSAQQQLNNAKLTLTQAERNLAGTVIKSPIAGTVLALNGSVGVDESPGSTPFITVGSVKDTEVSAQFSEADVAPLKVGQRASITVASRTQPYPGKVSQIDPAGTASGQLVKYGVMISFDTPPADLLYGQTANVTVTTASVANVLYVSSSAVTGIADGSGQVTVRTGGRDVTRTVHIGLRGDQYTEIQSGLSLGDQVVISGAG